VSAAEDHEPQLRTESDRAHRAARMLEDDLFKDAISEIREWCHQQWENSPIDDVKGRENLRIMVGVVNRFEHIFAKHVETGKLALKQINDLQEKRSRLRLLRR
jgi:limonene-1,2-epoxide hydrolase